MIITRTPFRVSFAGGGTDLGDFYRQETGAVVSTAINKYMYVTVNKRFDNTIRVGYSKTEIVSKCEDVQHPIVREALKLTGINGGIEIVSIADIPSGTGLGSSSSFTVGLLNALHAYNGDLKSADELASEACFIEIEALGEPIGKQDQYIAAHGGIRHIHFNKDESVFVDPIILNPKDKERLQQSLILLYTGDTRSASSILNEQKAKIIQSDKYSRLIEIRDLANDIRNCMLSGFNLETFGDILHRGWMLKKELAGGISNALIDDYYNKARKAGAIGGKLLGAGGGGFLLLCCPIDKQARVRHVLGNLKEMSFSLEPEGSKIIYVI